MAGINWASAVSGTFTTATDWTGGVVPGKNDTAIIAAAGHGPYTITVDSSVILAGMRIRHDRATVSVTARLRVRELELQRGTLALDGGSLSGTVLAMGGVFEVKPANGTLDDVTWRGNLQTATNSTGTLFIKNGLTLTDLHGTGPGNATFHNDIVLENTPVLDHASIDCAYVPQTGYALSFRGDSLTLGTGLNMSVVPVFVGHGQTLTNNGTLTGAQIDMRGSSASGTVVNNGVMSGLGETASSFQNDGTINGGVELAYAGLQNAGPSGAIVLGSDEFDLIGRMTTSQYMAAYLSQNVMGKTGDYTFGVIGTVDNTGATLTVGAGTVLGDLGVGTFTGGTIIDQGAVLGVDGVRGPILKDLTLQTSSATYTINAANLTDVTLTGASTLDCPAVDGGVSLVGGTLSGLGTLNVGEAFINGVNITGLGDSGQVTVNVLARFGTSLEIGGRQSVAGYTFDLASTGTTIALDGGTRLLDASLDVAAGVAATIKMSSTATQTAILGSSFDIGIASGATLSVFSNGNTAALINYGTINNAGTVSFSGSGVFHNGGVITGNGMIGATGEFDNGGMITATGPVGFNGVLNNTGTIDVSGGNTLSLTLTTGIDNSGTIAVTGGELDINFAALNNTGAISITNGTLGVAGGKFGGTVTLGALSAISAPGSVVEILGYSTLDLGGQSITLGQGGTPQLALAEDAQITDGTVSVLSGTSFSDDGLLSATLINNGTLNTFDAAFDAAVSGAGTIVLSGENGFNNITFNGNVGPQTIAFSGPLEQLAISAKTAPNFGGTLSSFGIDDRLFLTGDSAVNASFVGSSISVTLASGQTLSFHTSTSLTGSLEIFDFNNGAEIVDISNQLSHSGQGGPSGANAGGGQVGSAVERDHGGALRWEPTSTIHDLLAMRWLP